MRQKTCKVCKEKFQPERTFQSCCSIPHAIEYVEIKKQEKRKKAHREQKRGIETVSQVLSKAEDAFRRYIRARDRLYYAKQGKPPECFSCGNNNPNIQYCAGHYKTKGAYPEYRLDEENCHLQCNKRCNKELSGNINGTKDSYGQKKGYVIRYGEEKAKEILARLEMHSTLNLTKDELRAKKKEFNRMARENEKELDNLSVIGKTDF